MEGVRFARAAGRFAVGGVRTVCRYSIGPTIVVGMWSALGQTVDLWLFGGLLATDAMGYTVGNRL